MQLSVMTNKNISELLPAVTATTNSSEVSSRYVHLQTSQAIDALESQGFKLTGQHGRKNAEHGKHGIVLVNREMGFLDKSGSDNFATVALFNSHDGGTALKLIAGYLRQICTNGMVSGHVDDTIRIRHSANGLLQFEKSLALLPERLTVYAQTIEELQNVNLTNEDEKIITQNIFNAIRETRRIRDASDLLHIRRVADNRADAWTFANRVQENIVRGGMLTESGRRLRPVVSTAAATGLTQLVLNTTLDYIKSAA